MEIVLVLGWVALLAALGAAGLPLAARLLSPLPGRGAGFALPIALLVLTIVVYWVGRLTFGPVGLLVGLTVLIGAAAIAGLDRERLRRAEFAVAPELDLDRGAIAEASVVSLLALGFVLAFRTADPSVYPIGGEKFLDFGLLKSLHRADALPPEDVWFAGEPVRYYYGGHLIAAILTGLTALPPVTDGIAPAYAYNLALATFYAMLAAGAYELAGAIGAARRGSRRLAGALGAFFVGVASNLVTPSRFSLLLVPGGLRRDAAGVVAGLSPETTASDVLAGIESFHYWNASRVIPGTINEFPLFAWLNGDLHAHMMGAPFLLLAAAVAYCYYRTPEADGRRRWLLVFGAVPPIAAVQLVVDTWSFPSVFGLLWLALTFAPADPLTLLPGDAGRRLRARVGVPDAAPDSDRRRASGGTPAEADETSVRIDGSPAARRAEIGAGRWLAGEALRAGGAAIVVSSAIGLTLLLGLPFLLGASATREIALLPAEARSALGPLILVHGAFLLIFAVHLVDRLGKERPTLLAGAVLALAVVALGQSMAAVAAVFPILLAGWLALRMDRAVGFETVLIVAGAGLLLLVEFVYVEEQAGPLRLNTVFKTYMQVWVLWGTAAGAALAGLLRGPSTGGAVAVTDRRRRALGAGLIAVLVVSTSLYGALAVQHHYATNDYDTLDATAFVEREHPEEARAIAWLDRREGQPTLLSAPGTYRCPPSEEGWSCEPGMYSWYSNPASSLTGVPTVAGWQHEVGYRGADAYYGRVSDVDRAYVGGEAEAAAVLRAYDVEYVWVGPIERDRYGDDLTVEELPGLSVAHQSGAVTVYEVDRNELPEE